MTTADVLDGHVSLDLECLDRIYLNGYVSNLQVGGQVVQFVASRGFPIPSPLVVGRIGERFSRSVRSFADARSLKVYAGSAPNTRASGPSLSVTRRG